MQKNIFDIIDLYDVIFKDESEDNICSIIYEYNFNIKNRNNDTPLIYAIKKKNKLIVKIILESKCNDILYLDYIDNNNNTALLYSALYSMDDIAIELIKNNCDYNKQNSDGLTILMIYISNRNINMIKYMTKLKNINYGLKDMNSKNILIYLLNNEIYNYWLYFINPQVDIESVDIYNKNVLIYAIESCCFELVYYILMYCKYNPNHKYEYNKTILHYIITYFNSKKCINLIEILINKNIDINLVDTNNRPAFYYAIMFNNKSAISYLINIDKLNVNIVDVFGRNALLLYLMNNTKISNFKYNDVLKKIISGTINYNIEDCYGCTINNNIFTN
jgi:ankyrin repeat protein